MSGADSGSPFKRRWFRWRGRGAEGCGSRGGIGGGRARCWHSGGCGRTGGRGGMQSLMQVRNWTPAWRQRPTRPWRAGCLLNAVGTPVRVLAFDGKAATSPSLAVFAPGDSSSGQAAGVAVQAFGLGSVDSPGRRFPAGGSPSWGSPGRPASDKNGGRCRWAPAPSAGRR